MSGKKRAAEESPSGRETRSSKSAKTHSTSKPTSKKTKAPAPKKGSKATLAASAFKTRALPLHINLTHTPPSLTTDDTVPVAPTDPGFIGSLSLVPSSFSTGSYGWKGSKRITVELQGDGEHETVQVQLTINAAVLGSKNAPADKEETADSEEKAEEEAGEEEGEEPTAE